MNLLQGFGTGIYCLNQISNQRFTSNIKLHQPRQALDNPTVGWNPQSIHYMSSILDIPPKTMYNGKIIKLTYSWEALCSVKKIIEKATVEPKYNYNKPALHVIHNVPSTVYNAQFSPVQPKF